jgi:hypothetical protein
MPTFDTRGPIAVHLEIGVGTVHIAAGERADTVVEVRPRDPNKKSDVNAAKETRVDYADGVLRIKTPKAGWRQYTFRGGGDAVDVQIDVPAGSSVRGEAGLAELHTTGALGEVRYKTGAGDVRIDEAGALSVKSGSGAIAVGRAAGHCDVASGSGAMRIGTVDGTAVMKNGNGDIEIGEVTRDLRVTAANGKVDVGRAHATVGVTTANGDIRLGEVARGAVTAKTAYGRIDVGVRAGVAAWLDLQTAFGKVESDLTTAEEPKRGEDHVELKARTAYGDITIRRSP